MKSTFAVFIVLIALVSAVGCDLLDTSSGSGDTSLLFGKDVGD